MTAKPTNNGQIKFNTRLTIWVTEIFCWSGAGPGLMSAIATNGKAIKDTEDTNAIIFLFIFITRYQYANFMPITLIFVSLVCNIRSMSIAYLHRPFILM